MKRVGLSIMLCFFVVNASLVHGEKDDADFWMLKPAPQDTELPQPAVLQLAQSHYIEKGRTIEMGESRARKEMTLRGRSENRLWYLGESYDNDPGYINARVDHAWQLYQSQKKVEKRDEAFRYAIHLKLFYGADINKVDEAGRTWLHTAVASGYSKSVEYLLEQGADRELNDSARMSPIALAHISGQKQIANLFNTIPVPRGKPKRVALAPPSSHSEIPFEFHELSNPGEDEFKNVSLDFLSFSKSVAQEPSMPIIEPNLEPTIEPGFSPATAMYEGNAIWDGTGFTNGWSQVNLLTTSLPAESDLRVVNPGKEAVWIEGGATGWDTGNHLSWTFETRIQFNDIPKGFFFLLGTDTNRIRIEVYKDQTMDSWGGTFRATHDNVDGKFHLIRIVHDAEKGKYHVWRDLERLTPVDGVVYDEAASDSRLVLGDFQGRGYGDRFDVTIDFIRYDQTGAYPPASSEVRDGP